MNDTIAIIKTNIVEQPGMVDIEDYQKVRNHNSQWTINHWGYVCCRSRITGDIVQLQKIVLDTDQKVDHINRNKLDNTRTNLRFCTKAQNEQNKPKRSWSLYKGVSINKNKKKWRARIIANGISYYLGEHKTPELAALTYDEAARKYHGEFAVLNFPDNKA